MYWQKKWKEPDKDEALKRKCSESIQNIPIMAIGEFMRNYEKRDGKLIAKKYNVYAKF